MCGKVVVLLVAGECDLGGGAETGTGMSRGSLTKGRFWRVKSEERCGDCCCGAILFRAVCPANVLFVGGLDVELMVTMYYYLLRYDTILIFLRVGVYMYTTWISI